MPSFEMAKPPSIPRGKGSLANIGKNLQVAALTEKVQSLEARLKASETAKSQLASALERVRKTPKARPVLPATPTKRGKEDFLRVILPDTHGCKVDKAALAAALGDLKALNPDEVILLGDHLDCGGLLAQHHVMGYVAETSYTYEEDIAATAAFLDALAAAAPRARIEYIEGTHERRVATWCVTQSLRNSRDSEFLRRAFAPEFLLRLEDRGIKYYRQGAHYDGLQIPGVIKRGKCYFTHGVSTAANATGAMLARYGSNLVFGHTHREQSSSARPVAAGTIKAWNPGCLCELQPLWQHTNPTAWTHGFAVQTVAKSGDFLHVNVPIIEGRSLLGQLAGKFQ